MTQQQSPPNPADTGVTIYGVRPTETGPLPGLLIDKDQIPGNIQSATQKDLKASHALGIGDFMDSQLQGVSINDYSGNPFQMDVNYRGFTASPQIGTPEGLSVFFDGIRVNEPFGDIVNWDLLPLNALERFDLFPGSNPLFGLNTLGGAISLRTRSGFTSPGVEGNVLGGSWRRWQVQAAAGGNNGVLGGFLAVNYFDEDGWRVNSPSKVRQVFGRADWRGRYGVLTASTLLADNDLIGNGLIPLELYDQHPDSIFSSPDQSKNKLAQFALSGALDVTDNWNITAQGYHRRSDRDGLNGDIYEGFDDMDNTYDYVVDSSKPIGQQIIARNGAYQTNGVGGITNGPGVVAGTPIGLLTSTSLNQKTDGGALQSNWNLERHKFMVGASIDRSHAAYDMSQRLGLIDASHRVYLDPNDIDPQYYAAYHDVPGNDFHGTETTKSVYFNETWSVLQNVHLTAAGRYNKTNVSSDLYVRTDSDPLHEIRTQSQILNQELTQQTHTRESFDYSSFNPEVGLNWLPVPALNLYGNLSRGARVPSVVELGCAFDATPVDITIGSLPASAPRSLVGPGCTLPTTLSGDPYLPQIRSTSGELGARGNLGEKWSWDLSFYRTNLKNDIYFVGVGDGKSYFDTIGDTRRQGLEFGVDGSVGPVDLKASYSFTDATFESTFYTVSPHNSTADFDQNSQAVGNAPELNGSQSIPSPTATANNGRGTYHQIRIDPGARLPGVPEHNFNATVTYHATRALQFDLNMIASSYSFVRGNENNLHQPGGTDQETGIYYCTNGAGCGTEGLLQQFVRHGRPFTDSGR
ncbi:MAG TPA: TonB-dependent receptor, partial [Steroidobacteraceae bacterium]